MSEPPISASSALVPYVDHHSGARRTLLLDLSHARGFGGYAPTVGVDGRRYLLAWGEVGFEIPADRPCHLSVHAEGLGGIVSRLLAPGLDLRLRYRVNLSGHGELSEPL